MREFARLYTALDETTATGEKVAALAEYFRSAAPADAAWAVHFLIGRRPKRLVSSIKLAAWSAEAANIPAWLFEESYAAVGDLAETITLLLPDSGGSSDRSLTHWVEERLLPLKGQDDAVQREEMLRAWLGQEGDEAEAGAVAHRESVDVRLTQLLVGQQREHGREMVADRPPGRPKLVDGRPAPDVVDAPRIGQERRERIRQGALQAGTMKCRCCASASDRPSRQFRRRSVLRSKIAASGATAGFIEPPLGS